MAYVRQVVDDGFVLVAVFGEVKAEVFEDGGNEREGRIIEVDGEVEELGEFTQGREVASQSSQWNFL